MSEKSFSIVPPSIIRDASESKTFIDYNDSVDVKKLSADSKIKLYWFTTFGEIYNEKMWNAFHRHINFPVVEADVKIANEIVELKKLYKEFSEQVFFNLWFTLLYSPNIKPSSKDEITESDIKLMEELIDEQMIALSSFRLLTLFYQDNSGFRDKETIKRKIIFLDELDGLKRKTNPESKSLLKSYIFELVLNKYKSDSITENLEKFLVEFEDVLPERLRVAKSTQKEKKVYSKFGELKRTQVIEEKKIYDRDDPIWYKLTREIDQYRNAVNRKKTKKQK